MKILVKRPNEPPEEREVPRRDDCSEYKKIIGCDCLGWTTFTPIRNVMLLCDDVGKFKGLPPNFRIPEHRDFTVGVIVFVGMGLVDGESDFIGLNLWQLAELERYLNDNSL